MNRSTRSTGRLRGIAVVAMLGISTLVGVLPAGAASIPAPAVQPAGFPDEVSPASWVWTGGGEVGTLSWVWT